jgi:tRNA U34 2-thiouridine synthase MnmA/TrmU
LRYNSRPVACEIEDVGDGEWIAHLQEPTFRVAPGQSAVFYTGDGERVVGGGVVARQGA